MIDKWIDNYFLKLGINPLYLAAILMIAVSVVDLKRYQKNWNELPFYRKLWIISECIFAIILLVYNVISFFENHF